MKDKLIPKVAKVQAVRELESGTDLLELLDSHIRIIEKVMSAAEEYLQDPIDPEKLFIGPKLTEIEVSYIIADSENHSIKQRATLQELLDKVEEDERIIKIAGVETDFEDPRRTILNAANTLSKQLDLYRKIRGDIHNVSIDLTIQPAFRFLVKTILKATREHPQIRREIAKAIQTIYNDNSMNIPTV